MRLSALCLLLLSLIAGPAAAQGTAATPGLAAGLTPGLGAQRTERIEAELVPMSRWAAPGSTAIVAVRQKIAPGWHTYWRNPGDSGGATTLAWTLPQGVTAGDIDWPTPERQRLLGLMNYGYSGTVYLPVPIQVPVSARPGETLTLTTEALFLVCSDQMCVPDELPLALDIEVRDGAAPDSAVMVQAPRSVCNTPSIPPASASGVRPRPGFSIRVRPRGPATPSWAAAWSITPPLKGKK